MPFRLRDDLSFCDCGGRIIFLDLKADRYFCLGPSLEASFRYWAGSPAHECEAERFDALRAQNLLVRSDGEQPAESAAHLASPTRDVVPHGRRHAIDDAEALASEIAAALRLRSRPLRSIVRRCRSRGTPAAVSPERIKTQASRLAGAFAFSALLLGATDRCLVRGIAATRACRRRGLAAALVFGVRVDPFAAHCWVQLGEEILVGDFDQVRLFTPILTVT